MSHLLLLRCGKVEIHFEKSLYSSSFNHKQDISERVHKYILTFNTNIFNLIKATPAKIFTLS